jgi:hypothetical protein
MSYKNTGDSVPREPPGPTAFEVCVMAYGIFFCLKMEMRTRRRLYEP